LLWKNQTLVMEFFITYRVTSIGMLEFSTSYQQAVTLNLCFDTFPQTPSLMSSVMCDCVDDAILNDCEYAFPASELNIEYHRLRNSAEQSRRSNCCVVS